MTPAAPALEAPAKTRFVVIDENVLGYVMPHMKYSAGILATSIIRGAAPTWVNGSVPFRADGADCRPATRADFTAFDVVPTGYMNDSKRYDFPAN